MYVLYVVYLTEMPKKWISPDENKHNSEHIKPTTWGVAILHILLASDRRIEHWRSEPSLPTDKWLKFFICCFQIYL